MQPLFGADPFRALEPDVFVQNDNGETHTSTSSQQRGLNPFSPPANLGQHTGMTDQLGATNLTGTGVQPRQEPLQPHGPSPFSTELVLTSNSVSPAPKKSAAKPQAVPSASEELQAAEKAQEAGAQREVEEVDMQDEEEPGQPKQQMQDGAQAVAQQAEQARAQQQAEQEQKAKEQAQQERQKQEAKAKQDAAKKAQAEKAEKAKQQQAEAQKKRAQAEKEKQQKAKEQAKEQEAKAKEAKQQEAKQAEALARLKEQQAEAQEKLEQQKQALEQRQQEAEQKAQELARQAQALLEQQAAQEQKEQELKQQAQQVEQQQQQVEQRRQQQQEELKQPAVQTGAQNSQRAPALGGQRSRPDDEDLQDVLVDHWNQLLSQGSVGLPDKGSLTAMQCPWEGQEAEWRFYRTWLRNQGEWPLDWNVPEKWKPGPQAAAAPGRSPYKAHRKGLVVGSAASHQLLFQKGPSGLFSGQQPSSPGIFTGGGNFGSANPPGFNSLGGPNLNASNYGSNYNYNPGYNANVRQLLHVGFKIAAQMGDRYLDALKANEEVISKCVTGNLLERHMKPLFA